MHFTAIAAALAGTALVTAAAPAAAQKKAATEVALAKCDAPIGTVAIVDGDTQGWTKYGLGSPRDLIAAMAAQSNCFTLHNPASGKPADFLMNAIAGDKEQVDQGMNIARTALVEGAVRSGAFSAVAGSVPFVGGLMGGMLGGLGGKKKTVAAGLRIISPATGQTIASGSGTASKSSITLGGFGGGWGWSGNPYADAARAQMTSLGYGDYASGGYANSKDGKLLSSAFIQAFNGVVAQKSALLAVRPATVQAAGAATAAK